MYGFRGLGRLFILIKNNPISLITFRIMCLKECEIILIICFVYMCIKFMVENFLKLKGAN